MVSLQYELLNVFANYMGGKKTLYTEGRYTVSHQYELLNVSASLENLQSFLYTGRTQMVSHQCELSYEFSGSLTWQMILCIWYN